MAATQAPSRPRSTPPTPTPKTAAAHLARTPPRTTPQGSPARFAPPGAGRRGAGAGVSGPFWGGAGAGRRGRGCGPAGARVTLPTRGGAAFWGGGPAPPPMFMMSHDPAYAPGRIEGQGYAKAKDIFAYECS